MKNVNAEFIISAVSPAQYPLDALPEIALAGRSNVGKSSLINRMINRKNLARTSSQPGKTQTLNYYRINNLLYFVDLPGYGYAKVSKTRREEWGKFIEGYLTGREELKLLIHLIDLRHPPTAGDIAMYEWSKHIGLNVCVVGTKADKISKGHWQKHAKIIKDGLGFDPRDSFVVFSSETGLGREQLWEIISRAAELPVEQEADGAPKAP
ncbi:ribosome biogenesis GTP-binding protein YihA/YsxC [Paenibacillus sp. YN15]|uniref:ribosome biogenesis GTP-binding protein YihA/YsxC n=1 Tax=Paenibacillus sp. YN15 TaxID=1742774 RepID=UPI000DCAFBA6|nr:ribosome biogenesis GTP-binding protein YihA/YsxC [Paenibacillus sp. YN15]RAV06346.1 YihA family ribosome biogenesis GTP-binding protein [Paenibacillus sp. YN15]